MAILLNLIRKMVCFFIGCSLDDLFLSEVLLLLQPAPGGLGDIHPLYARTVGFLLNHETHFEYFTI